MVFHTLEISRIFLANFHVAANIETTNNAAQKSSREAFAVLHLSHNHPCRLRSDSATAAGAT